MAAAGGCSRARLQPPSCSRLLPPSCSLQAADARQRFTSRRATAIPVRECRCFGLGMATVIRDVTFECMDHCVVCEWSTRGGPGQQANGPWAQVSRPTGPGPRSAGQWVLGPGQQANGPWAQVTEPTGHGLRSAGQRALGRGQEAGVHASGRVLAARSSPRGPPPHRGRRAAASRRRRSPGAD